VWCSDGNETGKTLPHKEAINNTQWGPVVEGNLLPQPPIQMLREGNVLGGPKVAVLMGSNVRHLANRVVLGLFVGHFWSISGPFHF